MTQIATSNRASTPAPSLDNNTLINGFDPQAIEAAAAMITADPALGATRWSVRSTWRGGTRVTTQVDGCDVSGQHIPRQHTIECDEPAAVLGTDTAANPQELLLAAIGSCMSVVYAIKAAQLGVPLQSLEVVLTGRLDMRGPFAIDPTVPPGFPEVECEVHVRSSASRAELEALLGEVRRYSPNFYHLTNAIPSQPKLVVGR